MNKPITINNNDVVCLDPALSLIGLETFKISQLPTGLKERWGTGAIEQWIVQGVPCELLKPGGGWQSGKIHIRFEFVLDEALPPAPPPPRSVIAASPVPDAKVRQ